MSPKASEKCLAINYIDENTTTLVSTLGVFHNCMPS